MKAVRCPACYGRIRGVHLCPPAPADRSVEAPKRRSGTPERRTVLRAPRPPQAAQGTYSHPPTFSWVQQDRDENLARAKDALTATLRAFTLATAAAGEGDLVAARFNLATIAEVCAAALRPAPAHSTVESMNTGKEQAA